MVTVKLMHDVFVSYAHVDNEALPGAEKGWVTNFINGLKIHLNKKLGRKENYSLWMDNTLRGNEAVMPAINDTGTKWHLIDTCKACGFS